MFCNHFSNLFQGFIVITFFGTTTRKRLSLLLNAKFFKASMTTLVLPVPVRGSNIIFIIPTKKIFSAFLRVKIEYISQDPEKYDPH